MDTNELSATYDHRQRGPWSLLLLVIAAVMLTSAWFLQESPGAVITFLAIGGMFFLLGSGMQYLRVMDEGTQLVVAFGPLPIFRRRLWYDDIVDVQTGRTNLLDGWGIHWSLKGGWVWNIWGYDCVVVQLQRGTLRVGTDEPDQLAAFIRSRIRAVADNG